MVPRRIRLSNARLAVGLAAFLAAGVPLAEAHACSSTQTMVYQSAKTAWCVETSVIDKYGPFPEAFFSFGDDVIDELVTLFDVPAEGVYTFEASVETGGAHTGSECCGLGVTVTGDAFYNNGYGVQGFWGYLLALHETINDWTGQVTPGWPTDFWADHVSAFPNSMDWRIMETLGTSLGDANLLAASAAQKKRFYPGGDSVDPRVPMFDQIFELPTMGYAGWARVFDLVQHDKMAWDVVADQGHNPDARRTEYVTAYVSLGAGQSVLPIFQAAGVANGMPDGVSNDPPYTGSQANVDAIANAHCAINAAAAQGSDVTADWAALRAGNYPAVTAQGQCGEGCPAECGCKASVNRCVAPWLADDAPDAGSGGAPAGTGGATGTGGSGEGPSIGSGCDCSYPSGDDAAPRPWLLAGAALAALSFLRARRR
ncbi:Hypothetical protein A7982_05087 [Minicystis rosea]|nr:Hypothetical protein A7982_05087 [Minicystis rosea]